jgi:hypothetical protein
MRVVLLLTVGLPVFAAQLVAFALPRVEVTPFALLRRVAVVSEREQARERVLADVAELPSVAVVPVALDGTRFEAPVAPENVSARALTFVWQHRWQAS